MFKSICERLFFYEEIEIKMSGVFYRRDGFASALHFNFIAYNKCCLFLELNEYERL